MGITSQFIKMLGATDEEVDVIVDKMSEKTAKEMLKVMMKEVRKHRVSIDEL